MRVVGAILLSAALMGPLLAPLPAAAAGERLVPGRPAGVQAAQERSYRWAYIGGGTVLVVGVAILMSNNNSATATLKISNDRDRVPTVIVTDSTVSTGSTH